MRAEKIAFNRDEKFDIQLSQALVAERRLGEIFACHDIEIGPRIELKTETWQWRQTGNICVEYLRDGLPSGISTTRADYWVHELCLDGQTLCWLMFAIERLKALARDAIRQGRSRSGAGDGGRQTVALIRLKDIL